MSVWMTECSRHHSLSLCSPLVPFLPVRDDFHPKRNQARQKLATLPKIRFKDLASDVFYELDHRYPHFQDEEVRIDLSLFFVQKCTANSLFLNVSLIIRPMHDLHYPLSHLLQMGICRKIYQTPWLNQVSQPTLFRSWAL